MPNAPSSNLAVRLSTAFLLLPFLLFLMWRGAFPFALLLSFAAALAAYELNLLPLRGPLAGAAPPRKLSLGLVASMVAAFLIPLSSAVGPAWLTTSAVLCVLALVACADALVFEPDLARAPTRMGLVVLGAVYPGLSLKALALLSRDYFFPWVLLCLVVTFWNDTGAYFAGRAFGKRQLAPRISPKKTWEGAIGGLAGSLIGGVATKLFVEHVLGMPAFPLWVGLIVGAGAAVLGPMGDLSESMIKRAYGVKDSGRLLPGHGGMLDRIDAVLFTSPFVLFCAHLLAGRT